MFEGIGIDNPMVDMKDIVMYLYEYGESGNMEIVDSGAMQMQSFVEGNLTRVRNLTALNTYYMETVDFCIARSFSENEEAVNLYSKILRAFVSIWKNPKQLPQA